MVTMMITINCGTPTIIGGITIIDHHHILIGIGTMVGGMIRMEEIPGMATTIVICGTTTTMVGILGVIVGLIGATVIGMNGIATATKTQVGHAGITTLTLIGTVGATIMVTTLGQIYRGVNIMAVIASSLVT